MNAQLKRAVVVCLSILLSFCDLWASGFPVFDAANFEESVRQLIQMEQQYEQLVRNYQMVRAQYEHMLQMARRVPVNMMQRYRSLAAPWRPVDAANASGKTAGWIESMNTGVAAAASYTKAVEDLVSIESAAGHMDAAQFDRLKTNLATVELVDGSNVHTLGTLGRLRSASESVEHAINDLELDSLSSDPAMNTELAVLNKINAATIIALRRTQDTNNVLVGMAEAQVIANKRTRDAEARALNTELRYRSEGKAVLDAVSRGTTDALRNWRIP